MAKKFDKKYKITKKILIGVPLPDFTKPPPNFGRFPPPPPHTTAMGFPPAQLGPGQLAPTLLSGATIQASNLPQLKPGTPQKGIKNSCWIF